MKKPNLYVFTISHYCEKARWALDYLGIDYNLVTLSPLSHTKAGQRLGLKRGSVPFLEQDGEVIQGSANIISWAERHANDGKSLHSERADVTEIQARLDDVLGVHVRRYFYSEAIPEQPQLVKPIFLNGLPLMERLKFHLAWGKVRQIMTKFMDLGPHQGRDSFEIIQQELDWLDSLLTENGDFLTGEEFTAADLAAASLFAPVVLPDQYPVKSLMQMPPRAITEIADWKPRPIWRWTEKIYATLR